jgi:Arc/MetJ-type ribon-helix-helix transcriptional regulator
VSPREKECCTTSPRACQTPRSQKILFISQITVGNQVSNILNRLELSNRREAMPNGVSLAGRSGLDGNLYDDLMQKVKQVAFQIDTESLAAIDALTPGEFSSRAEVLRVAVRDWLARRRADAIDGALTKGYGVSPPGEEEDSWADRSLEGLEASRLDW